MGKGFNNYMCKKFFHPASKDNLKRVWMAQQKHDFDKKKQDDLQNQYQKEQEMYAHRALLGDTKAKLGLSFMYDAPSGVNKNREKEEGEPEYKFEWQGKYKAPREVYNKNDDTVQDQPFGIEVRNVRCIKCHKWGHMNTDKICPLFKEALTAEPPQPKNQEIDLLRDLQDDGMRLKQVVMGRKNDPSARNQQLIDSDEEDPESQFLKSLSDKQRKKLLKKIEKLSERDGKKRNKSPDSDHLPRKERNSKSTEAHHREDKIRNGHSSRLHEDKRSPSPQVSHRKQYNRSPERYGKRRHSPSPKRSTSRRSESPVREYKNHHSRREFPPPNKLRISESSDEEQNSRRKPSISTKNGKYSLTEYPKRRDSSNGYCDNDRYHKSRKSSDHYRSSPSRKYSSSSNHKR